MDIATTAEPARYVRQVADKLADDCRGQLIAAIVHGSAALGGWQPGRSDVDVLFVVADAVAEMDLRRMALSLVMMADDCPGSAIETSIVSAAMASTPAAPWPYLRHVAAGPATPAKVAPAPGEPPHDPDLLMHYAVCRAAGISVLGPPPADLIGAVGRPAILDYLARELQWGLAHAPEAYAVLNACRAQLYLTDGRIVSKLAGGEIVGKRGTGPALVVSRALAQQRGLMPAQPPGPDAAEFVLATAAVLGAAAAGTNGS